MNLTFEVLFQREDGFHEIRSLFQAIDLGDHLSISIADRDHLTGFELPPDNTILTASRLFRKAVNHPYHFHFHLEKNIPLEAGLGGGSSNGATTLFGLNQLLDNPLTHQELAHLGAQIGSDVPFFFSCGRATCTGRGEIVTPEKDLPEKTLWLVKPPYGLSTPEVYAQGKRTLEEAAFALKPELKKLKAELQQHCDWVQMTGSGTTLMCSSQPPSMPSIRTSFLYRTGGHWYKSHESSMMPMK